MHSLVVQQPAYWFDSDSQTIKVGRVINFNSMFVTILEYGIGMRCGQYSVPAHFVSHDLNRLVYEVQTTAGRSKPMDGGR